MQQRIQTPEIKCTLRARALPTCDLRKFTARQNLNASTRDFISRLSSKLQNSPRRFTQRSAPPDSLRPCYFTKRNAGFQPARRNASAEIYSALKFGLLRIHRSEHQPGSLPASRSSRGGAYMGRAEVWK